MPAALDRFILNVPRLFLKQYPYAWFPAVALWTVPPNLSLVFFGIIAVGLLSIHWQISAWISHMRREHAGKDGKFYVDRPAVPWGRAVRTIAILLAAGGLVASFLNGQFGLVFWQLFLIFVAFTLTYQDFRFFGFPTIYIITASGIAVYFATGHLDYRLFFTFKEISRIERTRFQKGKNWDFFGRTPEPGADGLLLIPRDINGFSKRIEKMFIAPQDIDGFVAQLPYGFK